MHKKKTVIISLLMILLLLPACGKADENAYNLDEFGGAYDLFQLNWEMNSEEAVNTIIKRGKYAREKNDASEFHFESFGIQAYKTINHYISLFSSKSTDSTSTEFEYDIAVSSSAYDGSEKRIPQICGLEVEAFHFSFLVDEETELEIPREIVVVLGENPITKDKYTFEEVSNAITKYYGEVTLEEKWENKKQQECIRRIWDGEKTRIMVRCIPENGYEGYIFFINAATLYKPTDIVDKAINLNYSRQGKTS